MEKKILRYTWVEAQYAYVSGKANLFVSLADYDRLEAENQALRQHQTDYMEAAEETRRALDAQNKALRAELETERMRLAACGVVAMANTRESAAKAREMHPDYWSASCENVADMVDSEMKLREELEALRSRVVVVPNRERVGDHSDYSDHSGLYWAEGWNDCLDELARLNSTEEPKN